MEELTARKDIFIFDAFGTLFKTVNFTDALRKIAGPKSASIVAVWRRKQLEYTWLYNLMGQYRPFNELTEMALTYAMESHHLNDNRIREILLPIFDRPLLKEGAFEVLKELKRRQKKVGILSNGTLDMLSNGVNSTGIADLLAFVLSVDNIRIYKPDPAVYEMAVSATGATADEVVFFSSNQWDVAGASTYGLDAVWVNQDGEVREPLPYGNVTEIPELQTIIAKST